MSVAGFCRNCLSKWYWSGACQLGLTRCCASYDAACEAVYGMPYAEYKQSFQSMATPEQLARFNASKALHAVHQDPAPPPPAAAEQSAERGAEQSAESRAVPLAASAAPAPAGVVKSDACCQDPASGDACAADMVARLAAMLPPRAQPQQAQPQPRAVSVGVLTVSDRAYNGVYEDLSGPELQACLEAYSERVGAFKLARRPTSALVPDEADQISAALCELANSCELVLTTGGTGLARRDVTPEATLKVVSREVRGIPEAIRRETARHEPLAALSRAVAGVREHGAKRALIVNLPGRPKAVRESMAVLLPLLPHALDQLLS
jgi:molybdopterin adenylyltransferase